MLDPRLNHVVAVSRGGSFTAAAEIVGVTQSAITKSVADLERQVGYSIFHRTSRGALLTEQGRDFVERVARLLDDAGELLQRQRGVEDVYAGTLRIGVCPASLEWRLAAPLERLLARHPSIRLEVIGATFERMVQQLRTGGVDVALGFDAAFAVWSDLKRTQLAPNNATVFVRRGHPILDRPTISVADLADFDFISPSDSRPYGEVIRSIYEDQGVEWQRRVHVVDYFPIVHRIVAKSDAIGVVAIAHGHAPAFQERFATLDALDLFPKAGLCCAIRAAWEPKPAVRAFISACVEAMPQ
ncbi:LysR family transcriptional regulator [Phenylobacterium sp.]|uniref:LysR family transcriptional regulator n=1 Tax=Phenylobacterium sp. TaxID=1871053 RepID=UPI00301BC297